MTEQNHQNRIEPYHKYSYPEYLKILIVLAFLTTAGIFLLMFGLNEAFFIPEPVAVFKIFKIITFLGDELFFIIAFSFIYFAFDKRYSRRLIIPFLLSTHLNTVLKVFFKDPRPPANEYFGEPIGTGYGLPSGHTQSSVGFYGFTFHQFKGHEKKSGIVVRIISFLLLILVPVSRLIIGAHDVQDVLFGYLFGYAVLLIYFMLEPWLLSLKPKLPMIVKILIGVVASLGLWIGSILLFPEDAYEFGLTCGALLAFSICFPLEEKYVRYDPRKMATWQRIVYGIVGSIITVGLYFGLSLLFDMIPFAEWDYIFRLIKYLLLGAIVAVLVPYIFTLITKQKE
ncbi:MAG: phosphatase PAP2 family protein [Candidatus Lokiarchaeota archaeon]|nr:phosphatase PAP2 family protein [Candidatus Lokiarchaeota archaeon]